MKKYLLFFSIWTFISSCSNEEKNTIMFIDGTADKEVRFLTIGKDTIEVTEGKFSDTLIINKAEYDYLQLNTWKWPKLVLLGENDHLNLDFTKEWIEVTDDINSFLLNKDSILSPYTAKWDMEESIFRKIFKDEIQENMLRIDSFFVNIEVSNEQIKELKQIEQMIRGHRTANFISFQERKDNEIDRSIYDFVGEIDFHNERLEKQINNRNFQYYYVLDKLDNDLPDSIYPFAAIDTINSYVKLNSIKEMIITAVVKSSLYDAEVNHDSLFNLYQHMIGDLKDNDPILLTYGQLQKLSPGMEAPEIGELVSINGDTIGIKDLRGENLLITVWGSWCPYCKEELPYIQKLMNEYSSTFTSVGISLDNDELKWKEYIKANDWKGIHLMDAERKSDFKKNYLVGGTNMYFLIDKKGTILMNNKFKPSSGEMEEMIRNLN